MTSQFISPEARHESGFRAWNFQHPILGNTSVLVEAGSTELRSVLDAEAVSMVLELHRDDDSLFSVRSWHVVARDEEQHRTRLALLSMLDVVFSLYSDLQTLTFRHDIHRILDRSLMRGGAITRTAFYQWPELWLVDGLHHLRPLEWVKGDGFRHPLRPPQPVGALYRRFIPALNKTLTFKTVDVEQDLDRFQEWMNQRRIAAVWELGLPRAELEQYLWERQRDPHIFSVFGYFDDEPFGYFELYWTPEDRLGPYYQAGHFDRGIHLLVGNPAYLGSAYFNAWFTGLCHFLFLDDPRTMAIMGEPRADNKILLKHLQTVPSFQLIKEFDFPHKRAALLECTRERFFDLIRLP